MAIGLERTAFDRLLAVESTIPEAAATGTVHLDRDADALDTLLELLEQPKFTFPIVLPRRAPLGRVRP
ncbi:alkyl sulfatase C-terminal domain-containing protein [Streptomyces sp. NPDC056721]|uniref:alkyl sulfatase C-terminal domain-containing protein n=1 Tax=unclassified Streptomyces TaxID=2593676 RepID=UPI00367763B0